VNLAQFKSQISSASKGATVGTITVTRAKAANYASGATALTMTIPITDQGLAISAKLTEVFLVKGNLGQDVTFNSYGTTFPAALSKHLTSVAKSRL
jgi:hypothetical protein